MQPGADLDELLILRDTLIDVAQATSLEARLRAYAVGAERLGFASAAVVLVSARGAAEFVIAADAASANAEEMVARAKPAEWDARFDDGAPALSFSLTAANERSLARLVVERPPAGYPHGRAPTLRLIGDLVHRAIDDARLVEVAERRAARLQRLHEVGGMLARSLDEREIQRELTRHVQRVLPCRGVIIAHPDVERGTATIALHIDGGSERTRGVEPLGGVLAEVARTGKPVRLASIGPDAATLAAAAELLGGTSAGAGSILAAPMLLGIQLVGVVAVYGSTRTSFNAEDEELLSNIAGQAASAVVNARLYEESQLERRQSEALSDIARAVGESLRTSEVMRLIQRHAMALLHAKGAMVMIRKGDFLHVVAGIGSGDLLSGMYLPLVGSLSGRAVRTGQCVLSNDTPREKEIYFPALELAAVRRTVIAPLITERGAGGALAVLDRDTEFTDEDARVLKRMADHVAVAVVNARLYEEISEATRELAITFDAIAGGLVVVDDDRRLLRCNSRAVDLLGAPNEASLHLRDFAEALLGEEHAGDALPLIRTLAGRTPNRGTVRNGQSGRVFDLVASPHPSGGAVVFFDDVTSQHALADRYRDLMERASDAIYTVDARATITSANAAMVSLLGVAREQLIGRSLIPFLEADELDELRGHFRATSAGEARRYECHLVRPDGRKRLVSVSSSPFRQGESIVGVLCIARDVTDERAAASALERAESRYARVVESAADGIFTLDEEGLFTSVNRALVDAVGTSREELVGRHFTSIIADSDRGAAWDMFVQTLSGKRVRRDVHVSTADGSTSVANVVTAPILESGRVAGALGMIRDLGDGWADKAPT